MLYTPWMYPEETSKFTNTEEDLGSWGFMASFDVKTIVKDKRFWVASFIIVWAAGLQGHMIWLQKQDSFKQKFGTIDSTNEGELK